MDTHRIKVEVVEPMDWPTCSNRSWPTCTATVQEDGRNIKQESNSLGVTVKKEKSAIHDENVLICERKGKKAAGQAQKAEDAPAAAAQNQKAQELQATRKRKAQNVAFIRKGKAKKAAAQKEESNSVGVMVKEEKSAIHDENVRKSRSRSKAARLARFKKSAAAAQAQKAEDAATAAQIQKAKELQATLKRKAQNAALIRKRKAKKAAARKERAEAEAQKLMAEKYCRENAEWVENLRLVKEEDAAWKKWKKTTWPGPELRGDEEAFVWRKWKELYNLCTAAAAAAAPSAK
jgi:hypothetical protein